LPTNGGEALTVIVAILVGFTMPMTPVQILWSNMITATTLGLALAFEPPEPGAMRRPPRPANAGLLSPFLVWRVVFVSLIFVTSALSIFFYALGRGIDLDTARTMVVNTIVVLEIFYLFNVRYLHMTSFTWQGALGTPAVLIAVGATVVAQLAFTYLPVMHTCVLQFILALTVFKKGLPKIMGQKSSCGEPRTRKSVGYLVFPHKTSTSLTIPSGWMVSLFASLIVTSMSSISAGTRK
jgi:magnesium-transporting ATPase (P-type)